MTPDPDPVDELVLDVDALEILELLAAYPPATATAWVLAVALYGAADTERAVEAIRAPLDELLRSDLIFRDGHDAYRLVVPTE